jgi:ribosomal protein S18 acetylase RimI-like enzyme
MYLNLNDFFIPEAIKEKEAKAALDHYEISLFDRQKHRGVAEMLSLLDNPLWEKEITQCTKENIPVLVAAKEGEVVGFAGPIIRQKNGRGYFTGIGVVKEQEGHGIGTEYMSLYTGSENPAGKIYQQAGFVTVQQFAIMRKMI